MKTKLTTLGSLLLLGLLTFSAQAVTLFQDDFEGYPISTIPVGITNDTTVWVAHSGTNGMYVVADPTGNSAKALQVSQPLAQDIHANIDTNKLAADITITNLVGPFTTNIVVGVSTNITATSTNFIYAYSPSNSVAALYASFTIYVTTAPTGAGQYFTHWYNTSGGGFFSRLFLVTNGAASGSFRVAIQNSGGTGATLTNTVPVDLSPLTTYTVVSRYILGSGLCEVWVNPTNESSITNATSPDSPGSGNIQAYAFRQASSAVAGTVDVDNLKVGTKFADAVPGSVNPPTIITQPNDTNVFSGSSATFNTFALGDDTIGYQWFSVTNGVTNGIDGANGKTLLLANLTTNQAGFIFAVVTNGAGTNSTRLAALNVAAQPIPPIIDTNIMPAAATNFAGDTVVFTVVAHGLPAPAYQWKFIPATNSLLTNIITGATSATLTLSNVAPSQAGSYFVTITNSIGYLTTNSAAATLTVNPPPFVSIAQLRSLVDPTTYAPSNGTALFTFQGIVTTWTNMTSGSSPEFYLQDNTAGIAVFWSGAGASNLPPAGSLVQITAPFEFPIFDGLLIMEPVFTNSLEPVTIISTNNPLPTPQPLPFDPNIQSNIPLMQSLVGTYFVASNVFLNISSPTFSSTDDPITNIAFNVLSDSNAAYNFTFTNDVGQTFMLFANSHTDIPGQTKPTGPVTIYGVLGQFVSSAPFTGGYEFTPSRFADIISYTHFTNVLANLTRPGDLPTNTFTESVLRPTESLTTFVSVSDPVGGTVTLTPVTDGLPSSAHWDNVVNGPTATAIFHFQPTSADAGSNYVVALASSSTSGTVSTNFWYVYVPTPLEQQIYISEFLANPTTNTNAPYFNPLHRVTDATSITSWDQYVEIANTSATDVDLFGWSLGDASLVRHVFFNGAPQEQLSASSAVVIYGGASPASSDPSAPVLSAPHFPADNGDSPSLSLAKSGTGVIILRNPNYFNSGRGIQPGYIVDRVVYPAGNLSTNGSLSRFPTINSGFVPQGYISTNFATAGLQYDGSSWSSPTKMPKAVTNVVITVVSNQALLNFTADTTLASTLWQADEVTDPFQVVFGKQFTNPAAIFSVTNLPANHQFYFITTQ